MVQRTLTWMALAGAVVLALPSMAMAKPPHANDGMVVDSKGMTLYTYSDDSAGTSTCVDGCAKAWPPAVPAAGDKADGNWTIINRPDGTKQWALQDMPLYTYAKDTKKGDMNGDGKADGKWAMATIDSAD